MKYTANWTKGAGGNQIKEGDVLHIEVDGAYFFSGGIYQKGFPVIAFQTQPGDNDIDVVVRRKDRSLKGTAILKVRAFDENWRGAGWNDEFKIV